MAYASLYRTDTAERRFLKWIFAEASGATPVAVTRAEPREVHALLAKRCKPAAIAAFLAESKRSVGSPWSREPQDAALAAWSVL